MRAVLAAGPIQVHVDFVRPLRCPWHAVNLACLGLGAPAPFLRDADRKQQTFAGNYDGE